MSWIWLLGWRGSVAQQEEMRGSLMNTCIASPFCALETQGPPLSPGNCSDDLSSEMNIILTYWFPKSLFCVWLLCRFPLSVPTWAAYPPFPAPFLLFHWIINKARHLSDHSCNSDDEGPKLGVGSRDAEEKTETKSSLKGESRELDLRWVISGDPRQQVVSGIKEKSSKRG